MKATHITPETCSVLTQINGLPSRKAYENSEQGREEFLSECAECENMDEVLAAWGDAPTVVYVPEEEPKEPTPTDSERISALERENAYLKETLEIILTGATGEDENGQSMEATGV